jgi:hypothetical protein
MAAQDVGGPQSLPRLRVPRRCSAHRTATGSAADSALLKAFATAGMPLRNVSVP